MPLVFYLSNRQCFYKDWIWMDGTFVLNGSMISISDHFCPCGIMLVDYFGNSETILQCWLLLWDCLWVNTRCHLLFYYIFMIPHLCISIGFKSIYLKTKRLIAGSILFNGFVHKCAVSIANAQMICQSFTKPPIYMSAVRNETWW